MITIINRTRLLNWTYRPKRSHKGYTWKFHSTSKVKLMEESYVIVRFEFYDLEGNLNRVQGIAVHKSKKYDVDDLAIALLDMVETRET